MSLWGAFSSASRTGLSRASHETRERIAPSFFSRDRNRGKEKEMKKWNTVQVVENRVDGSINRQSKVWINQHDIYAKNAQRRRAK